MRLKIQFEVLDHWFGFEVGAGTGVVPPDEEQGEEEREQKEPRDFKPGFQSG